MKQVTMYQCEKTDNLFRTPEEASLNEAEAALLEQLRVDHPTGPIPLEVLSSVRTHSDLVLDYIKAYHKMPKPADVMILES